jgi:hypothetical protein
MAPASPLERLSKLEERVNGFRELFVASNQAHDDRLEAVEKSLTWAIRIFISSSLAIIGTLIAAIWALKKP